MCFTGGFALAMMVDDSVVAPVLRPAVAAVRRSARRAAADLNLSPADLAAVKERAAGGCEVLGLRYRKDPAVGTRFDTLTRELGDGFIRVEFEGKGHSTVTGHRQQEGVDRVLAFFAEQAQVLTTRKSDVGRPSTAYFLGSPGRSKALQRPGTSGFPGEPGKPAAVRPRAPARSSAPRCRR